MIADCFARGEINLNVSLSLSLSFSSDHFSRRRQRKDPNLFGPKFMCETIPPTYPYGRNFDFVLLYSLNPILSLFIFVHLEVQYEVKQQSEPFKLTKASMLWPGFELGPARWFDGLVFEPRSRQKDFILSKTTANDVFSSRERHLLSSKIGEECF